MDLCISNTKWTLGVGIFMFRNAHLVPISGGSVASFK